MDRYAFDVNGVPFNPTLPPGAVRVTGGGRPVNERVSVTGRTLRSRGPRAALRIQVQVPDDFALLAEQVAVLESLYASGQPFTVTLGPGYEASGTFTGVVFDGDAVFTPTRSAQYDRATFTLYVP